MCPPTTMTAVTLDAIALDLGVLNGLPQEALESLLGRCATVEAGIKAKLLAAVSAELTNGSARGVEQGAPADKLLDAKATAELLAITVDQLYRHGKSWGLAVKLGDGTLRFSSNAIQAHIKARLIHVAARCRSPKSRSM